MHHGLIKPLRVNVEETCVPKAAIVEEARGLRAGDATRPSDLVVLDFTTLGRHLIMDGVVTLVYKTSILARVAAVHGFAAKKAEDMKFKSDKTSDQSVAATHGGHDTFVLFATEDDGRIGAHG